MATGTRQGRRARSYHHGDLRSALIAATSKMLERDGPEAISFRAIARAAGVSQTAPYNHFRSKEHLLATLAAAGFRDLEASQLAAAASAGTDEERIEALGRDYVRFACSRPQLYRLMFGVGVADWCAHPDLAQAKTASYQPVQQALASRLATVGLANPESVATASIAAWALVHGLSMLLIDRAIGAATANDVHFEALVADVTTWFTAGLEAGAAALRRPSAARKEKDRPRRLRSATGRSANR
jgi:AcrR family transcriptional regulator